MKELIKEREEVLTTLNIEPIEVKCGVYDIAPQREEVINE
jgi:hypothetical protein